jgi:excisionase family DNA binding protein
MKMTDAPDRYMKVRDVAEIFDVTPATIRDWLNDGILPGVKIGGGHYWRVKASDVYDLAQRKYGDGHDD